MSKQLWEWNLERQNRLACDDACYAPSTGEVKALNWADAEMKRLTAERDALREEVEKQKKYACSVLCRCEDPYSPATIRQQALEEACSHVLPAIREYRSCICEDEPGSGNGSELTDLLANAYGDATITNALKEIDSLADEICGAILYRALSGNETREMCEWGYRDGTRYGTSCGCSAIWTSGPYCQHCGKIVTFNTAK